MPSDNLEPHYMVDDQEKIFWAGAHDFSNGRVVFHSCLTYHSFQNPGDYFLRGETMGFSSGIFFFSLVGRLRDVDS